jgi:hypothetical protein
VPPLQFRSLHGPTLSTQWGGIVAMASLFALSVGFNNLSLLNMPLSLNQVIRWVLASGVAEDKSSAVFAPTTLQVKGWIAPAGGPVFS